MTYAFRIDIITIGNYLQGHIITKSSVQICRITNASVDLSDRHPIYLYYHTQGYPDQPSDDPDHFAYLQKYSETEIDDEETFCTESISGKPEMNEELLEAWNSCLRSTTTPLSDESQEQTKLSKKISKPSEQPKDVISISSTSSSVQPSIHSSSSSAPITQNSSTLKKIYDPTPTAFDPTQSMTRMALPFSNKPPPPSQIRKKKTKKMQQNFLAKRKLRDLSDLPSEIKIVRTHKKSRDIKTDSTSTDCTATLRQVKKGSKDQLRKGSWRPPLKKNGTSCIYMPRVDPNVFV